MSDRSSNHTFAVTVAAGLVGAGLALLLAPSSGRETRAKMRNKANDLKAKADDKMAIARDGLHEGLEHARVLRHRLANTAKQVGTTKHSGGEKLESEQLTSPASSWGEEI